jgi:hypothetical protein
MKSVLMRATKYVLVGAAVMICAGCPREQHAGGHGAMGKHAHNIAQYRCANRKGENYQIDLTKSAQVLNNSDDTIIFVCENDTLTWSVADPDYSIKVTFTDNYADDLFGSGGSTLGSHQAVTSSTVKNQHDHNRRIYKYSIELDDKSGAVVGRLDPHVIPMGN